MGLKQTHFQGNDLTLAPQHPCTPAPIGGAFGSDAAFFAGDNLSGIQDPVEHAVTHLLHNIVDGDRGAGVVEVTTAAVTSGGGKQGSVGSLDSVAEEAEFLDQGNEGMEGFQVTRSLETRFYFPVKFENNLIRPSLQRPALHGSQLKAMKMVPFHHDR
jgi:hypothetical protein